MRSATVAPAGILYAEDFDAVPADPVPPPPPPPLFTEAECALACEAARSEGLIAGRDAAEAGHRAEIARALAGIAAALDGARAGAEARASRDAEAVARLLLAALGAALPELCRVHGPGEAAAVARAILPALAREPAVTVRAAPRTAAALEGEAARLDPDLAGRLRVVGTPDMTEGDVRIAWTDGTAICDSRSLWDAVLAALAPLGLAPSGPAPAAPASGGPPLPPAAHPPDAHTPDAETFAFEEAARAG